MTDLKLSIMAQVWRYLRGAHKTTYGQASKLAA